MKYTTTSCPHCGFRTRNHEPGVQKIELDQTIECCPRCKHLIIDPIKTEYEFMTNAEREKWQTSSISAAERNRGIALLIISATLILITLITGAFNSSGFIGLIIFIIFPMIIGINKFVKAGEYEDLHIGEQLIYESLLRTSNIQYVNLLKKYYGNKRTFNCLQNRTILINTYQKYSSPEIHNNCEKKFLLILEYLKPKQEPLNITQSISATSTINGGALIAGVMAVPSLVTEIKQQKDISQQNSHPNISLENKNNLKNNKDVDLDEEWIYDDIFKYTKSDLKLFAKDVNVKNWEIKSKNELIESILNTLNKTELINLCKNNNISGSSNLGKLDIIKLIIKNKESLQ